MDEFHKSRRGTTFFDVHLPSIADSLKRIADALEKQNKIEEKKIILESRTNQKGSNHADK